MDQLPVFGFQYSVGSREAARWRLNSRRYFPISEERILFTFVAGTGQFSTRILYEYDVVRISEYSTSTMWRECFMC